MSTSFELVAELREDVGKGASRRLRRAGKVPAILYGGHQEPRALLLNHDELSHQLENEAFYSHILTIKVGEITQMAILKDLQRHPARRQVMHADFLRVLDDETIRVNVPLHFINEAAAPGVKHGGAVSHLRKEVEIECLPKHLPEFVEVDVSGVEMDGLMYVRDVMLPEGVKLAESGEDAVLAIHRVRKDTEIEGEEGEEGGEAPTPGES